MGGRALEGVCYLVRRRARRLVLSTMAWSRALLVEARRELSDHGPESDTWTSTTVFKNTDAHVHRFIYPATNMWGVVWNMGCRRLRFEACSLLHWKSPVGSRPPQLHPAGTKTHTPPSRFRYFWFPRVGVSFEPYSMPYTECAGSGRRDEAVRRSPI
jgi:hypothetical protein